MIDVIEETTADNEFLKSVLRFLKTTLNDRYILLQSPIDFPLYIDFEKIQLVKEVNETFKIHITNVLKSRVEDFTELDNYLKFLKTDYYKDKTGFLLLVEVENHRQIISSFSKYKKKMDKEKQEEIVTFYSIKPKFSLNEIILNEDEKEDIISALTLIRERELIYDVWGFSEIDSKPRLILNFYGVPGTGKTMSAHAVAHELNKNILLINYSEIESKYVGDAPKNLMKAFEKAKKSDAVLFFDEADSFLGKRVENVSSSSDQSVNSLRSQMLILLEDFEGIVIFATNLVKNYDSAFESRILKHLEFRLPSFENRVKILDRMLVDKIPFEEKFQRKEVLMKLAELTENFSGRELKNAVLESLSLAVHNGLRILNEDVLVLGFQKNKQRKESIENNKNKSKISPELKERLEERISNTLKSKVSNLTKMNV